MGKKVCVCVRESVCVLALAVPGSAELRPHRDPEKNAWGGWRIRGSGGGSSSQLTVSRTDEKEKRGMFLFRFCSHDKFFLLQFMRDPRPT